MLHGTWIFCGVKIFFWQKTPNDTFVKNNVQFSSFETTSFTYMRNTWQRFWTLHWYRIGESWLDWAGCGQWLVDRTWGCNPLVLETVGGITWSVPFPTTVALQKMKEDLVLFERQWPIASATEMRRMTKINKITFHNKYFQDLSWFRFLSFCLLTSSFFPSKVFFPLKQLKLVWWCKVAQESHPNE